MKTMGKRPWEYPSFFKVMIAADFIKTLRVPPMFKKHLGETPSDRVVLRTPRGQWQVGMGRKNCEFCFLGGWEDFVVDNSISVGEFAVFFYDGDAGFDVVIFGTSSCGREHLPLALREVKPEPETSVEDIEKDPLALINCKKRTTKKNARICNLKAVPSISKKRKSDQGKRKVAVGSKNKMCYKVMRTRVPNAEYEKAIKAAYAFKATHPHFIVTCRPCRSSFMPIPAELDRLYNFAEKHSIDLRDPNGVIWPIKLSIWRDGRRCLSSGWSLLYKKHCIKDGDACLLEVVQGGNAINIHLFRLKDCTAKSDHRVMMSLQNSKVPLLLMMGAGKGHRAAATTSTTGPTRVHALSSTGKNIQFGKRLPTNAEKERVLNEAKSFVTEHPKFVAIWRLSMRYQVNVPLKVVKKLNLRRTTKSRIVDPRGRSWPVKVSCRVHGQVSLGIGWNDFVNGNNLDVGDACVFEFLRGTEEIQVHIFRTQQTNSSAAINILEQSPDRKSEVLLC